MSLRKQILSDILPDGADGAEGASPGSHLRSCQLNERAAASSGTESYVMSVIKCVVDAPSGGGATHVDGPKVAWKAGMAVAVTGDIAPGPYG